ncbi:ankyrin repeat protein [Colletotrichum kahawae]|uniref:Ankyrin repeat protein n=1 Tax=Colletotrichum kahawae TaxID=34407 RepID=A0AAD9YHS2_COLKA|nr:ankyrin repeat protein [Colletotrichum kahawae]
MQHQSTTLWPAPETAITATDTNESQSACAVGIVKSTTTTPKREGPRPTLEQMPPEILLLIVDAMFGDRGSSGYNTTEKSYCKDENCWKQSVCYSKFSRERDVIRLAATCKKLHNIISPAIFKHDIRENYSSALILSAKSGLFNVVLQALEAGADVDAPDRTGFDFHQEVCDSQVNVETERFPVSSSLTALHWAAFFGNEDMMRLLIGRGANTNARADMGTRSYLNEDEVYWSDEDEEDRTDKWEEDEIDEWEEDSLSSDHPQRAMFCHTNKEYDDQNRCGANALFFALKALHGRSEPLEWRTRSVYYDKQFARRAPDGWRLSMAKLLIEHGSSLITREYGQIHALHQASVYGQTDIVRFVIDELGTDPNIRDEDKNTPLHYVAIEATRRQRGEAGDMQFQDLRKTTQLLLDRGADPCLQNSKGLTSEKLGLPRKWLERA